MSSAASRRPAAAVRRDRNRSSPRGAVYGMRARAGAALGTRPPQKMTHGPGATHEGRPRRASRADAHPGGDGAPWRPLRGRRQVTVARRPAGRGVGPRFVRNIRLYYPVEWNQPWRPIHAIWSKSGDSEDLCERYRHSPPSRRCKRTTDGPVCVVVPVDRRLGPLRPLGVSIFLIKKYKNNLGFHSQHGVQARHQNAPF